MASRHQPAHPLIVICMIASLGACSRTVTIVPNMMDADATVDITIDEETEVASDPIEEEPESTYEFNTCLGVCALQAYCLADSALSDPLCGAMCSRLTSESRACLNDAIETSDCSAFWECQGELESDCEEICRFVLFICNPYSMCGYYCPMYTAPPRECAFDAAGSHDCGRTAECLVGHSYGATCHDACTMLIETCGVDADFDSCLSNCGLLEIDSMSRACIDAAKYYLDCEALAACGGLVP